MNLERIISTDEQHLRTEITPHVRARESFDHIKLQIILDAIERHYAIQIDRDMLYTLNAHINMHIKPLHGQMMTERLDSSARNKPKSTPKTKLNIG